jgi:hypothetical protein
MLLLLQTVHFCHFAAGFLLHSLLQQPLLPLLLLAAGGAALLLR